MTELPAELVAFEERLVGAAHSDVRRWRRRRVALAFSVAVLCAAGSAVAGGRLFGISAFDDESTPPAPPSVVAAFRTLGMPAPGVELPPSTPVDARSLGQGIYVAERDGTLCVWIVRGAGQCGRTFLHSIVLTGDQIRAGDSETSPFQLDFAGVARDGVSAVQIATSTSPTVTMPVTTNGFRGVVPNASLGDVTGIGIIHTDGSTEHADPAEFGLGAKFRIPAFAPGAIP